jgi:hypothetical protein
MFGRKPTSTGSRGEQLPEKNDGLPDSERPSGLCPRCGKQSSFEALGALPATYEYGAAIVHKSGELEHDASDRAVSLQCRHCGQCVIVIEERWIGDDPNAKQRSGRVWYKGFFWWPLPQSQVSSDVPIAIAEAFAEAGRALFADCPRAAAAMARRALEAVTVDMGETTGVLAARLAALSKKGILLPTLADGAKEVRLVGNSGAHFDLMDTVTKDDAQQLITFMRELLRYLYELPAELARRRP